MATANTETTKLTPEEQKTVAEAAQQSQALMSRVGVVGIQHKTLADLVAETKNAGGETVMGLVPKNFVLTLDNQARDTIQFEKGVREIPKVLLDHWYVKAHKVEEYAGTTMAPRTVPILSSNVFAADKGMDPAAVNDITVAAYTLSGLTPEQWNALSVGDRGEMMRGVHEHRQQMAERARQQEEAKAGGGAGTGTAAA